MSLLISLLNCLSPDAFLVGHLEQTQVILLTLLESVCCRLKVPLIRIYLVFTSRLLAGSTVVRARDVLLHGPFAKRLRVSQVDEAIVLIVTEYEVALV